MSDFGKKQPAPAKNEANIRDPKNQGGQPKSGIAEAPLSQLGETGPGEAIPANRKVIH